MFRYASMNQGSPGTVKASRGWERRDQYTEYKLRYSEVRDFIYTFKLSLHASLYLRQLVVETPRINVSLTTLNLLHFHFKNIF